MDLRPYLNRWVILGALGFAGILILITLVMIGWMSPRFSRKVGFVPADLTMIPAPTHTPNFVPTPTIDPLLVTPTAAGDAITAGRYGQINGTAGHRIRMPSSPGLY